MPSTEHRKTETKFIQGKMLRDITFLSSSTKARIMNKVDVGLSKIEGRRSRSAVSLKPGTQDEQWSLQGPITEPRRDPSKRLV